MSALDDASAAHRRRLFVMLAIDGVCALVAFMMILRYFRDHADWALIVFAGAILVGFGAQIWMMLRWWQTMRRPS